MTSLLKYSIAALVQRCLQPPVCQLVCPCRAEAGLHKSAGVDDDMPWILPLWLCPSGWVRGSKLDDIVVAFHIFPFLVFLIAEISPHTGNSEILAPAVEGRNAVILPRYQPPVFIKSGLHGKLVMLKCEVGFRCAIVGIFRADMFECCQQRHPLSARLQTLGQQGRKPPPVPPPASCG